MKLDLRAPLIYERADNITENDFKKELIDENREILLCYTLNIQESRSIEPDQYKFLDSLSFIGRKTPCSAQNASNSIIVALPAGKYLFNQCRALKPLDREEWLYLAIEQQKDGLWERHNPDSRLYVRYLLEDKAFVTQVFRLLKE